MLSVLWHEIVMASRLFGVRDRLRCPSCGAVGTWKPHGGWQESGPRRWLCKWCGSYRCAAAPDVTKCRPSNTHGCWVTPDVSEGSRTPAEVLADSEVEAWPWRG